VSDDPLLALAASLGVTAAYTSWQGAPTRASREAVRAVLGALGHPVASDEAAGFLAREVERAWWRDQAPCTVAWDGRLDLTLRVPAELDADVAVELALEDGSTRVIEGRLFGLPASGHAWPDGVVHCYRHVRIADVPWGYHVARWRFGDHAGQTHVIAAPVRAWGAPESRSRGWGGFAPTYALRDAERGGAGDLGTLGVLAAELGRRGAHYLGTLPLLATFLDELYQPSPYAPASRLAWNELYLDVARAPGLDAAPAARALLAEAAPEAARLAELPLVDYAAQYAWRRRVIDALAESAWAPGSPLAGALAAAATPGAVGYAAFRAVGERTRTPWTAWTEIDRAAAHAGLADAAPADAARIRSHLYAQWAMDQQLAALAGAGGAGLYLDLPVGVGRDSYDVFAAPELFVTAAATGAPPDSLFVGGQDWGLPPLHPERVRASGWRYVAAVVRHHMRHAAMLRVDHIMGLHRLYWVPVGFPATDGVYVHYAADELWAILCLESHRNQCAIAGEDLGTVPPEVPAALARHGGCGLYVRQFAMPAVTGDPVVPAHADAIACLNTHDTPTFAGWWAGDDIVIMRELGFITEAGATAQRHDRAGQRRACVDALVAAGMIPPGLDADAHETAEPVMAALYTELAAGPAHDLLVTLEDLWLEPSPQNVPGTSIELPNWRRPWSRSLAAALADPAVAAVLDAVAARRR
jgi:4-alpha-glucanotransferase